MNLKKEDREISDLMEKELKRQRLLSSALSNRVGIKAG